MLGSMSKGLGENFSKLMEHVKDINSDFFVILFLVSIEYTCDSL